MTAIFISHSSADNAAAAEMKRRLQALGHVSVFLDFDPEAGIAAGNDWEQTLYHKLRQCQAVIALLTPGWLASKWCFAELVQARERGKAIFPVKVQPCDAGGVFGDIQHIDLTTQPETGYERLRIGLLERGLDPLDVFDWDPRRPPYPGLLALQEADAALFFGRGEEVLKTMEALDAMRRQGRGAARFALLLGASGSGKSSLVRAGVIPRLKKKANEWLVTPPFRPQIEPLDELSMALAAAFEAQGKPRDWSAIRSDLDLAAATNPPDGQALLKLARDLAMASGQPEATVLLTIDQAEEWFGYTPADAATRFLRLLRAGLEAADRRLMVVATLRSDFLGDFQNHPALQDNGYPHHFAYRALPVDPMPLRGFAAIIQGPARLAGLELGDGLVEAMVRDTGTPDALPLLAFTLRRLYERFGRDGRLSVDEYESLGRLEGAVREEAQRLIAEVNPSPEELEALHAAFVPSLVRINAEGAYARRCALLADLPQRALPVLRKFVDTRLLVTDRDSEGRETIEFAHESLLRTWPLLGQWLAADQDKLRLLKSIQAAAEDWERAARREELLAFRDGRLKDAESLLGSPRFTVADGSVERAYLIACRNAQDKREKAERLARRRLIVSLSAGLMFALLLAAYAFRQQDNARQQESQSRRLLYAASVNLAQQAHDDGDVGRAHDLLDALVPAEGANKAASLGFEWYYLWRVNHPRVLRGISRPTSVAYSPDGRMLAYGSGTKVEIIDAKTYAPLGVLAGHSEGVMAVVFSPDGLTIASASGRLDGYRLENTKSEIKLWDVRHRREIAGWKGHAIAITCLAISADGKTLASGSADDTAKLWDLGSHRETATLSGHQGTINSVAFSPDGKMLATASEDKSVRLWVVSTAQQLMPMVQERAVQSVAFSPDGKTLAAGGGHEDNMVWLWNVADRTLLARLAGLQNAVGRLDFSPDGRVIAAASDDSTIGVWSVADRRSLAVLRGHARGVESVAFSPDGRQLVSAGVDDTIRVWNVESWAGLQVFSAHKDPVQNNHVSSLDFSPDGKILATAGWDGTVKLWDADTHQLSATLAGHGEEPVADIRFSPDGKTLASAGWDKTIKLWDVSKAQPLATFNGHTEQVATVRFTPDGKQLVSSSWDGTLKLWDIAGRRLLRSVKAQKGRVGSMALSPDGRTVASSGDVANPGAVKTWDVQTLGKLSALPDLYDGVAGFTSDGMLLTYRRGSGGEMSFVSWDLSRRREVLSFKGSGAPVALSPDGQTLAAGGQKRVVLWHVPTAVELITLTGDSQGIESIAFSPDGKSLAVGYSDGGVGIRRAATEGEVAAQRPGIKP